LTFFVLIGKFINCKHRKIHLGKGHSTFISRKQKQNKTIFFELSQL